VLKGRSGRAGSEALALRADVPYAHDYAKPLLWQSTRAAHRMAMTARGVVSDRFYLLRPSTPLGHPILGNRLVVLKGGELVAGLAALSRYAITAHAISGAWQTNTGDGWGCAPTGIGTAEVA